MTWAYFIGFVAIGLVVYFSYSIRHSHLEPNYIMRGQIETSIVEGESPAPKAQDWSNEVGEKPIRKAVTEPEEYMLIDANGEKRKTSEAQKLI